MRKDRTEKLANRARRKFGFVEAALGHTLACGESAVASALMPVAFDMMFLATVLRFVLASGVLIA